MSPDAELQRKNTLPVVKRLGVDMIYSLDRLLKIISSSLRSVSDNLGEEITSHVTNSSDRHSFFRKHICCFPLCVKAFLIFK